MGAQHLCTQVYCFLACLSSLHNADRGKIHSQLELLERRVCRTAILLLGAPEEAYCRFVCPGLLRFPLCLSPCVTDRTLVRAYRQAGTWKLHISKSADPSDGTLPHGNGSCTDQPKPSTAGASISSVRPQCPGAER